MYRDFNFLNLKSLNDYYSIINNGIADEKETLTSLENKQSGGAHIAGLGGDLSNARNSEIKEKISKTDALKFSELYIYMEKNNEFSYIDTMNDEVWSVIKRKDLIEAEVVINIPKSFEQLSMIGDLVPLIDMVDNMGGEILKTEKDRNMLNGIKSFFENIEVNRVPLICEMENDSRYKFIVELPIEHIRGEIKELKGDMTIFGKVQKIYNSDEVIDIFNIFSSLQSLMELSNNPNHESIQQISSFFENVQGPAIKLIPLALYR